MPNPLVGLHIDANLTRAMKIRALEEGRSLQDITAESLAPLSRNRGT